MTVLDTRPVMDFWVAGTPVTQGSKAPFINRQTGRAGMREIHASGLAAWRNAIATEARRAVELIDPLGTDYPTGHEAFVVALTFGLQRPASAPKRTRTWPIGARSGDVDKLARAALDAVTGVVLSDDSQVVGLSVTKAYGRPGLRMQLWPEEGTEVWVPEWNLAIGSSEGSDG